MPSVDCYIVAWSWCVVRVHSCQRPFRYFLVIASSCLRFLVGKISRTSPYFFTLNIQIDAAEQPYYSWSWRHVLVFLIKQPFAIVSGTIYNKIDSILQLLFYNGGILIGQGYSFFRYFLVQRLRSWLGVPTSFSCLIILLISACSTGNWPPYLDITLRVSTMWPYKFLLYSAHINKRLWAAGHSYQQVSCLPK